MNFDVNEERFGKYDAFLFHQGTMYETYRKFGAHLCSENGVEGTRFSVWAPNAKKVSVLTERTNWDPRQAEMTQNSTGIWELFLP